jgi:rhamnose transport system ATP-binding protein
MPESTEPGAGKPVSRKVGSGRPGGDTSAGGEIRGTERGTGETGALTADVPVSGERKPIFALESVSKHFGGITAVDGVDYELFPGEVHALVGENGAGKSTLMKMVVGYYRADEGIVKVHGEPVTFHSTHDAEAAGIYIIPQELDLFPELTVAENLYVGRARPRTRWGGLDWDTMQQEARARFESVGINVDVSETVKNISVANRQIVLIARALMGEARAVVMDEPTSSLTDREVERLMEIIADLTSRGVGVVYISHRLGEVFAIADRITVMRDGRHIVTAPAAELDSDQLIRHMVGRKLTEMFSRIHTERGKPALELKGFTRHGEFSDVDLVVRHGEVVGLAGLIGAGRTELAQAIFGTRRIDRGDIMIDGERVIITSARSAMEHGVFYVPEERQSQGLILQHSSMHNISLGILSRISRAGFVRTGSEKEKAERFAENLSIRGAPLTAPVSRLSGGNQQKVVLAKSLALEPSILLLDEPTRGVDVGAKREIYRLIDDLASAGKAILLISSELEEVLSMSDRVVVMREGELVAEFSSDEATQEKVMVAATGVEVLFETIAGESTR